MGVKVIPQAKGYSEAGASRTRRALKGFIPNSGSPDEDINRNLSTLRQRSRLLYMAAPLAASAINTSRTKAIGSGLQLQCSLNAEELPLSPDALKAWSDITEADFAVWSGKARHCDALGLNHFSGLQQVAFKSWLMSGDVFVLIKRDEATAQNPYTLRLQLIEADRVCTPDSYGAVCAIGAASSGYVTIPEGKPGAGNRIYDGVEIDPGGKVVAYHICSCYPQQANLDKRTWTRVLAVGEHSGMPNVLHIMEAERPDQYRGVPAMSSIIEPMLQLRRYTESELTAALVQSMFTAWIETETDPTQLPFNEVGAEADPVGGISNNENEIELAPGTVIHLKPGEKVQFGNPNIPTAGFETFVKTMSKLIGAGQEMPYDVLMKEFNSSYSASRGALLECWEMINMKRAWFTQSFCQPIYELWLTEAIAIGRIRAPGFFDDARIAHAWARAQWIGPVQGQLDPKKEVEANAVMVKYGWKTNTQVTREMTGGDWDANVAQIKRENQQLREAGAFGGDGQNSGEGREPAQ